MATMTYLLCERIIEGNKYGTIEDMTFKLDVFLLNNRITSEEYEHLVRRMNEKEAEKNTSD